MPGLKKDKFVVIIAVTTFWQSAHVTIVGITSTLARTTVFWMWDPNPLYECYQYKFNALNWHSIKELFLIDMTVSCLDYNVWNITLLDLFLQSVRSLYKRQ